MESMIHFSQPYWILAGLALCAGVPVFFRMQERLRQARLARFAGASLLGRLTRNVSPGRRTLKKGLWLAALFCCFLALARPQYGLRMIDVKRKGIDILFALDTSKSMLTEDIRPNRLERAKLAIMDFVGQLDGDRVGLLPFAGSAFLMTPLTIDYSAFEESLAAVNTSIIPRGGTDLAAAITEAEAVLGRNANHKILVLLTDGESLEGDAEAAAVKAAEKGMLIFTVGVGTAEGELIPLPEKGAGSFVKDEAGRLITSRLDQIGLTAIAEAAGGIYAPLGKNGEGLEQIYQQKLTLIPKKELAEKQHKEPLERFSWPLGAALLLLVLEFMISGRRSERFLQIPFIKTVGRRIRKGLKRGTVALFLMCLTAGSPPASHGSQGEKAFADGDYPAASEYYAQALKKNPGDPRLHYNSGTAAYKNNLFDQAITSFQEALKSDDLGLQEQSYYNLGNALYKKGEELAQSDPGQTEQLWQEALKAYDGSAGLNPQGGDARENRKLVAKKLEELKQQQEQKKQQQEQGQKQDDGQQGRQAGEQQGQGDEQSDKQDNQGREQKKDAAASDAAPEPEEKPGDQAAAEPAEQPADKTADDLQQQGGDEQADDGGKDQAVTGDEQKDEGDADQAARQDAEKKQGQPVRMTGEEARQLLNRLKDEEGRLNFVPQNQGGGAEKGTWKDW